MNIVNDESGIANKWRVSLTDDTRVLIYNTGHKILKKIFWRKNIVSFFVARKIDNFV